MKAQSSVQSATAPEEHAWQSMLHQLALFAREHGHAFVPLKSREFPKLGDWLSRQVRLQKEGKLTPSRQVAMERIGVEWDFDPAERAPAKQSGESRWEERIAQLAAFQKQYGHLHVTRHNETHRGLMHWRDNQRLRLKSGVMTAEQKARLDALGFEWEPPGLSASKKDECWQKRLDAFIAYQERTGSAHVPATWKEDPGLAKWVLRMREHRNNGSLPSERKAQLDAAGFVWKSDLPHFRDGWEGRFAQLAAFKQQHGHLHVTRKNQTHAGLMHWRDNQRLRLKSGAMTADQKERLDALGFEWEPPGRPALHRPSASPNKEHVKQPEDAISQWEWGFALLQDFHRQHGHARVPHHWPENAALERWARQQRFARDHGSLHFDQQARLNALGFHWLSPADEHWLSRFGELCAFAEERGHCHVPKKHCLRHWIDDQRKADRKGKLRSFRKQELERLPWQAAAQRKAPMERARKSSGGIWEQRFRDLQAFHHEHGHFRVPKSRPELKKLHHWVVSQRHYLRKGTLAPQKAARLDEIGFPWEVQPVSGAQAETGVATKIHPDVTFKHRVAQLLEFKARTGHVNYPVKNAPDQKLGNWVSNIRIRHRHGTLSPEKTALLEQIGFKWIAGHPADSKRWGRRFAELEAFIRTHGHPCVPARWPENPKLATWVITQRRAFRLGTLTPDRVVRLGPTGLLLTLREYAKKDHSKR